MNPYYEIEKVEAKPMLQAVKVKLTESGYKCRKLTRSDDGFVAKNGENLARIWVNFLDNKALITWRFYCDPSDPLHQLGIDYLIESTIVNFSVSKGAIAS